MRANLVVLAEVGAGTGRHARVIFKDAFLDDRMIIADRDHGQGLHAIGSRGAWQELRGDACSNFGATRGSSPGSTDRTHTCQCKCSGVVVAAVKWARGGCVSAKFNAALQQCSILNVLEDKTKSRGKAGRSFDCASCFSTQAHHGKAGVSVAK